MSADSGSADPGQYLLDLDQEITVVVPFLPVEVERPTWHLEPFSGKETRCPKCQIQDVVKATWHNVVTTYDPCYNVWLAVMNSENVPQDYFPEHIDRRCTTCDYAWTEGLAERMED